jgi:hypothetical protein
MRKTSAQKLLNKLAAIDARCKASYVQRDTIEAKLIQAVRAAKDSRLPIPGDRFAILKDNFVDPRTGEPRNMAFKTCAVKRFEVVIA